MWPVKPCHADGFASATIDNTTLHLIIARGKGSGGVQGQGIRSPRSGKCPTYLAMSISHSQSHSPPQDPYSNSSLTSKLSSSHTSIVVTLLPNEGPRLLTSRDLQVLKPSTCGFDM